MLEWQSYEDAVKEQTVRYYSTQRPLTLGSYPNTAKVEAIRNFDEKTFCEEIGREAWGYMDCRAALTEQEARDYELTRAGLKLFWCVTTAFDDKGRVVSAITATREATEKPENGFTSTRRKDIYTDWFDSMEAANVHVQEAKRA